MAILNSSSTAAHKLLARPEMPFPPTRHGVAIALPEQRGAAKFLDCPMASNFDGRLMAFIHSASSFAVAEFDAVAGRFSGVTTRHVLPRLSRSRAACFVRRDDGSDALLALDDRVIVEYNIHTEQVERVLRIVAAPSNTAFHPTISCAGDAIVVGHDDTVRVYAYSTGALRVVLASPMNGANPAPYTLSADGLLLFVMARSDPDWYRITPYSTPTGKQEPGELSIRSTEHPTAMLRCADGSFVVSFAKTIGVFDDAGEQTQLLERLDPARNAATTYLFGVGIVALASHRTLGVLLPDVWYTSLRCACITACLL